MTIGVCGFKDKRLLLAVIAGLLGQSNTTMLISRNESLLIFSPDFELEFVIGKATVNVVVGELSEYVDMFYRDVSFLVVDVYSEIPDVLDLVVIADSRDYYIKALEDLGMSTQMLPIVSMMNVKKFVGTSSEVIVPAVSELDVLKLLTQILLSRTITGVSVEQMKPVLSAVMSLSLPGEQLSVIESRIKSLSERF